MKLKQATTRRASKTRQNLLAGTVELMNEKGCNVGTVQIAEHCGISPGNLYYHFANREEILREIFQRMERDLHEVLDTREGEAITAQRLAGFYAGGARVLWQYRFLFSSATDFIVRDPWLADEYQNFSEHSIRQMERIIAVVTAEHGVEPKPDVQEIRAIAENKWVIWIAWPRYAELRSGNQGIHEDEFARGLAQIFGLLTRYISKAFREDTGSALEALVHERIETAVS